METWATFSIIDHRTPLYRQALAMFDKIVVPVPSSPIGNQTTEELDQLETELAFLSGHGAAIRFPWKPDAFQDWRQAKTAEANAANLNHDAYYDTRIMVAEKIGGPDVQAFPVYESSGHFAAAHADLIQVDTALTQQILQRLPVPEEDTSLDVLVKLRESPAFRQARDDLSEWKQIRMPAIVLSANREAALKCALKDFDKLTKAYAEAMAKEGFKKITTVTSIFFSLSKIKEEIIGKIVEGLVGFTEVKEPCWKKVSEMKCAPGGVVYHFAKALGKETGQQGK